MILSKEGETSDNSMFLSPVLTVALVLNSGEAGDIYDFILFI